MPPLTQTGTAALLEELSPFLDDELINSFCPDPQSRPASDFSSAQLSRVLLLSLLIPVHSFNLLVALLPENRAWRRFAHLHHRHEVPTAKMLSQFRARLDLSILRSINAHLLWPLLEELGPAHRPPGHHRFYRTAGGLYTLKKLRVCHATHRSRHQNRQVGTEQMIHRLQKAQLASLVLPARGLGALDSFNVLDSPYQVDPQG
ncbi:MAG TPA: transposase [Clostridia bacterium]|nr:transposase [Clostridia bacterium]